jgi:hypothetical protein
MDPKYLYLLIFVCIAYLIITDENIAGLINYSCRRVRLHYEKTKWIILNDPRNPIVRWNMERRSYKLAKEIQDEMERKSKSLNNNSKNSQ